jgi:hypothetical protein
LKKIHRLLYLCAATADNRGNQEEPQKMTNGKRSFSPSDVPEKGDDYHGGCTVFRLFPDIESQGIQSVNIVMEFEEALQLATAIQSAILKLNRYKRSSKAGKDMGLCLSLKPPAKSLRVIETKLVAAKPRG